MNKIICIHPKDETTDFLNPIGKLFSDDYIVVEPNDSSHSGTIEKINSLEEGSTVIFLGHGTEHFLFSAEDSIYEKKKFIDIETSNKIFSRKQLLLISCLSSNFLNKLNSFNAAIGFGNIKVT